MACILNIETATPVCSAALACNGSVVFEKSSLEGPSHAALLGTYVEEALAYARQEGLKLDAVGVSSGPGSYTGLRIGVSLAKGLCYGAGIPLIAVPTLKLLAAEAIAVHPDDSALYCAMLDAHRMEVYAALYTASLEEVRPAAADIVTAGTYAAFLDAGKVYFFGNGAAKCKETIVSPNAVFIDGVYPLAAGMARLSEEAYGAGVFEDVAYFEPFYLKEFVATVAKNKVLSGDK
ncbi:MAG: tRNA (adenosine(37)-N6)-threonylcarbamoyltransferase complex dimerization subunit type 1 TsaB [Parabacteroides sp.]|nr:tRNA (adenosine(37)-N6)-threonylcarbamoyltransferase complex dimerization subunit type 1 TsaB [Parabacteroides sp.]